MSSTLDIRMGAWSCHLSVALPQTPQGAAVKTMATSPSGSVLAVALSNGSLSLLDTRTGKVLAVSLQQHSDITKVSMTKVIPGSLSRSHRPARALPITPTTVTVNSAH